MLAPTLLAVTATSAVAAQDRQVVLIVLPARSYGEALEDPFLSRLAASGGIGLLTTAGGADEPARTAVGIGAGRSAEEAPAGPVAFAERDPGVDVALRPYVDAAGGAVPGALGSALAEGGLRVAYVDPSAARGAVALLAAMDRAGHVPSALLEPPERGGALEALLAGSEVIVSPDPRIARLALRRSDAAEVLVIVVGAGASRPMRERGETVGPIVLARGEPGDLLEGRGEPAGLTSSTTGRDGIVADADVAPTILAFLGVPVPDEMVGEPIRLEGEAPTELLDRYLDHQRVVGPITLAALAFALVTLAAGLVLVLGPWRAGPSRVVGLATLASASLLVALLPASMLPSYRPGVVVAALAVVTVALTALALRLGRRDRRVAVATIAAAGLGVVVLDGLLGWPSELTPMLGGGALDGERFVGLGNAWAGVVLAGAVLGAARLGRRAGVALIVGAAAFAGLPFLGADLGGCVTLAAAAALWFGTSRWRFGWRTWALAAAAAAAAVMLVPLAARVLPGDAGHLATLGGSEGPVGAALDRLADNLRTTSATPAAWLAVLGLPAWLLAVARGPGRIGVALEDDPGWRDAVVVLAVCGIVGFLVNDTHGLAGTAFTFVSAAVLVPALDVTFRLEPRAA